MNERIAQSARSSRSKKLKGALSRDTQRIVDFIWRQAQHAKARKQHPRGFRANEFELPPSKIAAYTGFPETSCGRIRDELVKAKWLKVTDLPSGTRVYRVTHVAVRVTPRKSRPLQNYTSKLSKSLQNSDRFQQISPSETTTDKGKRTGGDSPRPVPTLPIGYHRRPVPSNLDDLRAVGRKTKETARGYFCRKHPVWFADTAGLHAVAPGASRDACPILFAFPEFEAFLGHLVAYSRSVWGQERLDKAVLDKPRHPARKSILKWAASRYLSLHGSPEERRAAILAEARDLVLGNYRDLLERRDKGHIGRPLDFASVGCVFEQQSLAHHRRKGWCVKRGKITFDQNFQTRDRYRILQKERDEIDRKQREEMKKDKPGFRQRILDELLGRAEQTALTAPVVAPAPVKTPPPPPPSTPKVRAAALSLIFAQLDAKTTSAERASARAAAEALARQAEAEDPKPRAFVDPNPPARQKRPVQEARKGTGTTPLRDHLDAARKKYNIPPAPATGCTS